MSDCTTLPSDYPTSGRTANTQLSPTFARAGDTIVITFQMQNNTLGELAGFSCSFAESLTVNGFAAVNVSASSEVGFWSVSTPSQVNPVVFLRPSELIGSFSGVPPTDPVSLVAKFKIRQDAAGDCFESTTDWSGCWVFLRGLGWLTARPFNLAPSKLAVDELKRQDLRTRCDKVNSRGSAIVSGAAAGLELSYHSENYLQGPASFGYGWNLDGFHANLTTDPGTGDLILSDGFGSFERWTVAGSVYTPAHPDNYTKVVKNTNGTYTLTFKDQSVMNFRADGKLLTQVDRNGLTNTFTYDSNDWLSRVTDGEGRGYLFDYGTRIDRQPTSIREISISGSTTTNGPLTGFEYNGNGRLWKITSPTGEVQEFLYNGDRLWKVKDPTGQVVTEYVYLPSGRVDYVISDGMLKTQRSEVVDGDNLIVTTVVTDLVNTAEPARTTVTTLNRWRLPLKTVDPLGATWEYQYNDFENPYLVTQEMDPNLNKTKSTYDNRGNLKTITDALNRVTTLFYAQETETAPINPMHLDLVTQIKRPQVTVAGSLVQYASTVLAYDANGNLTTITDAATPTPKTTTYNVRLADGRVLGVTDRNNNTTSFTYTDASDTTTNIGNLKTVTTPADPNSAPTRTTTFGYDKFDNLLTSSGPGNNAASYQWYDDHRMKRVTDALSRYTHYNYLNGRLDTIDLPPNQGSVAARRGAKMLYDVSSRVTEVQALVSAGVYQKRVGYSYDSFSRTKSLVRLRGGNNKTWQFGYDILDRPTSSKDPLNRESSTTYAKFCLNYLHNSPSKTEHLTVMDSLCRVTQMNTLEQNRTFVYDELGRLTQVKQKTGVDSKYFDPAINPPSEPVTNPLPARFGTARYQTTAVEEIRSYEYNSLDRLTKITYPDATTTEYLYDFEGRVTSVKDPNGNFTLYEYYNDDRLYKVTLQRTGFTNLVFEYSYDAAGRLYDIKYPTTSGIIAKFYDTATPTPNSGWDAAGQLKLVRYEKASADLVKFEYFYDDSGNRTQEKKTVGANVTTWDYTYDWFSRLLTVKKNGALQVTYTYDESDNRATEVRGGVTKTYVYDDANQLVSSTAGGVTENFTHDLDGNMTSRTVSGVTTNYLWDQDMRLKRIDGGSDQLYDAEGIRKKTGATSFYSSGAASIADRGAANLTYVQGHQIMASANGATVLYYLHDGLSSVRALADAGGTVTANLDYDEFGAPVTANSNPHTYVGGLGVRNETSTSPNLYYMRARWFACDLGRFISADPIGFAGGLNHYAYVGNNPAGRVDPSGLAPNIVSGSRQDRQDFALLMQLGRSIAPEVFSGFGRNYTTPISLLSHGDINIGSHAGAGTGDRRYHRIDVQDLMKILKTGHPYSAHMAVSFLAHELTEAKSIAGCRQNPRGPTTSLARNKYIKYHYTSAIDAGNRVLAPLGLREVLTNEGSPIPKDTSYDVFFSWPNGDSGGDYIQFEGGAGARLYFRKTSSGNEYFLK